jgi:hypothetical protein
MSKRSLNNLITNLSILVVVVIIVIPAIQGGGC